MNFLKGLGLSLAIILGSSAVVAMVGGIMYATVPPAAAWMDEYIFVFDNPPKEEENVSVEDETQEPVEDENEEVTTPETTLTARINFNTKTIILEVWYDR